MDSDMDNDIKIYFNERIVVLTDKSIKSDAIDNHQIYLFENKKALAKELLRFEESTNKCLYITHTNIQELFENTTSCFKYIEAAGGLVSRPDGRMLFIKRLGKWDLPKGKTEKGESLTETALREVVEECGLAAEPLITSDLAHTYHTYYQKNNHILKHTAWFAMAYNEDNSLTPQLSEDITDAVWLQKSQLEMVMQNTYESVKIVLSRWLEIIES